MRRLRKGDLYVAYPDERPALRVYIEVMRVAKDRSWADIRCVTWAAMWTKRQVLPFRFVVAQEWPLGWQDVQESDHMEMLHEQHEGCVPTGPRVVDGRR